MDNEVEIMRVVRIPPSAQLIVEIGTERYEKLTDVPSEPLRRRLMAAVGELIIFVDGYDRLVQAGVAPPLAAEVTGQMASSLRERQAAFQELLDQKEVDALVAQDTLHADAPKAGAESQKTPPTEEPQIDLVGQIDVILQKRLAANPRFSNRAIRLESDPAGGLQISVDGRFYQRPADIEEQAVRQVITDSLAEWEST